MKKWLAAIIAIILIAVGIYAVAHKSPSSSSTAATTNTTQQSSSQANSSSRAVAIKDMMFTPSQITVNKGDTVTWTNKDSVAHTVTADKDNAFDSGSIAPGSAYSHTFNTVGSYQYHCSFHSEMHGTVVVR